jgi:hypothetical protein
MGLKGAIPGLVIGVLAFCACNSGRSVARPVQDQPSVASGSKGAVPPDGQTKSLSGEEQNAWRQRLDVPARCTGYDSNDPSSTSARVMQLDSSLSIVDIPCMLGAYQGSHLMFLWNDTAHSAKALTFSAFEKKRHAEQPSESQMTEIWGQTNFDNAGKQLLVFSEDRQIGDCGWQAVYTFPNGTPSLREFRLKTVCDGKDAMKPDKWPLVSLPQSAPAKR